MLSSRGNNDLCMFKDKYFKINFEQGLFLQQARIMGEDVLSGLILTRRNANIWHCR